MDNKELIADAQRGVAGFNEVNLRNVVARLAAALEAAEAELKRRGEAREQAWASYQSEHGYTTYPTQPDTGADFAAGFDAGAALAAAPVSLEAVKAADVPVDTVVRSAMGTIACRVDALHGVVFGEDRPFLWSVLADPIEVLWLPVSTEGDNRV